MVYKKVGTFSVQPKEKEAVAKGYSLFFLGDRKRFANGRPGQYQTSPRQKDK